MRELSMQEIEEVNGAGLAGFANNLVTTTGNFANNLLNTFSSGQLWGAYNGGISFTLAPTDNGFTAALGASGMAAIGYGFGQGVPTH